MPSNHRVVDARRRARAQRGRRGCASGTVLGYARMLGALAVIGASSLHGQSATRAAPARQMTRGALADDSRIIAAAVAAPCVSLNGGVWTLEIPRAMATAIGCWDPTFVPLRPRDYQAASRQLLFAVQGQVPWAAWNLDANGDRRPDLVLVGHTAHQWGLLAVVSGPNGYTATLLEPQPWGGRLAAPLGQYVFVHDERTIDTCDARSVHALGASFGLQTPDAGGPLLHYLTSAGWRSIDASC